MTSNLHSDSRREFLSLLKRSNEVTITVEGRNSEKKISTPVWFVFMEDEDKVILIPLKGSDTNWFKNLEKHNEVGLSVSGKGMALKAKIVRDPNQVERVLDEFRAKYRTMWSESYYVKRDVYVEVQV